MSSTTRRGSSISTKEESVTTSVHFKWDSIKKFVYIGFAYSSTSTILDLFVKGSDGVRIFEYVFLQLIVGITYLCMDFFIKQYTRKVDFMTYLNPLLRGITYGSMIQSSMMVLGASTDLSDIMRYLVSSFSRPPSWSLCNRQEGQFCIASEDIVELCTERKTNITDASIHLYYVSAFRRSDRAMGTSRSFISAVVWLANFFCSTLNETILVKMMRISFLWSISTSFILLIFITIHHTNHRYTALIGILNITSPTTFNEALGYVTQTFAIGLIGIYDYGSMSPYTMIDNTGPVVWSLLFTFLFQNEALGYVTQTFAIGLIGIHDYGSMSPYTMIDNTVVIYTIVHTLYAFQRAWINRILILKLSECVNMGRFDSHYLLFVISPLSMHFLPLENLHIINFFLTMSIQGGTNVAMITVTISKMLHNEFHSIRSVYIVGLLCALGFLFSLPMITTTLFYDTYLGIRHGLGTSSLFLGFYKVAIIMYVYGVKNFTTDIHFWLGYKPTKYWTLNWMIMPIILFIGFVQKLMLVYDMQSQKRYVCTLWIAMTFLIVGALNLKMVIKYLQKNNVMGLFLAHPKYGPLDREFLKKRKVYNETLKHKVCKHNCIVYDESYTECFHVEISDDNDSDIIALSSSVMLLTKEKSLMERKNSQSSLSS